MNKRILIVGNRIDKKTVVCGQSGTTGYALPEDIKNLLKDVQDLCNTIVNSPSKTTIKGVIESKAFSLGHHPYILNA
jgi:hypothetical protein